MKPWGEVAESADYIAMPRAEREAARQQYFDQVVAPQVPEADRDTAFQQFSNATTASLDARAKRLPGRDHDEHYNTILTNDEEKKFSDWKAEHAPEDSGMDYDLRGAFKADLKPDANGHMPDTYKKPNHPTFSDLSRYKEYGNPGRWDGDTFVPPDDAHYLNEQRIAEQPARATFANRKGGGVQLEAADLSLKEPPERSADWKQVVKNAPAQLALGVNEFHQNFKKWNAEMGIEEGIKAQERLMNDKNLDAPKGTLLSATNPGLRRQDLENRVSKMKKSMEARASAEKGIAQNAIDAGLVTPQDLDTAQEAFVSLVKSATPMALGAATMIITKNPVATYMVMGGGGAAMQGASTYEEARAKGIAPEDANKNALIDAGLELFGESLPVGAAFGKLAPDAIKGARLFKVIAAEAGEEVATQFMQDLHKWATFDPSITWDEMVHNMKVAGLAGAGGGFVFGASASAKDALAARLQAGKQATPQTPQEQREGKVYEQPPAGEPVQPPVQNATPTPGQKPVQQPVQNDTAPVAASTLLGTPEEEEPAAQAAPQAAPTAPASEPLPSTVPTLPEAPGEDARPQDVVAAEHTLNHASDEQARDRAIEQVLGQAQAARMGKAYDEEVAKADAGVTEDTTAATQQQRAALASKAAPEIARLAEDRPDVEFTHVPEAEAPARAQRAAKLIASAFGKKVVFVKADPQKYAGSMFPDDPSTVYVNVNATRPFRKLTGHELLHTLKRTNQRVYANLLRSMRGALDLGKAAGYERYYAQNPDPTSGYAEPPAQGDTRHIEEMTGDIFGDLMDDPKFWLHVFQRSEKPLVKKLWDAIRMMLDVLRMKLRIGERRSGYDTRDFITDIEGVRKAAAQAYADWQGGKTAEPISHPRVSAALASKPYEKAPDSLMGFKRGGQNKGFDETNYKHTQPVRVKLTNGEVFTDEIKGLNQAHALERARRNWEGAEVEPISSSSLESKPKETAFRFNKGDRIVGTDGKPYQVVSRQVDGKGKPSYRVRDLGDNSVRDIPERVAEKELVYGGDQRTPEEKRAAVRALERWNSQHASLFSIPFKRRFETAVSAYERADEAGKRKAAAETVGVLEELPKDLAYLKRPDGRRVFADGPVIGTVATIYEKGLGKHRSSEEDRQPIPRDLLSNIDDKIKDPLAVVLSPKDHPNPERVWVLLDRLGHGYASVVIDPTAQYGGEPVNMIVTTTPRSATGVEIAKKQGRVVYKKAGFESATVRGGEPVKTAEASPSRGGEKGGTAEKEIVSKTLPEGNKVNVSKRSPDADYILDGDEFNLDWREARVPLNILPKPPSIQALHPTAHREKTEQFRNKSAAEMAKIINESPPLYFLRQRGLHLLDGTHRVARAIELGLKEIPILYARESSAETKPRERKPKLEVQAHRAATSPRNELPQPTEAQKKAGNYPKGHVRVAGLDVSVENPEGSTRTYMKANGQIGARKMTAHYGYIRGTEGADGDHLDIFIKPGTPHDYEGPVFVADQTKGDTRRFDEHKALLGWDTVAEAKDAYDSNYQPTWKGLESVVKFDSVDSFKTWIDDGNLKKRVAGTSLESRAGFTRRHELTAEEQKELDLLKEKSSISDKQEEEMRQIAQRSYNRAMGKEEYDEDEDPAMRALRQDAIRLSREADGELRGTERPGDRYLPELLFGKDTNGDLVSPDGRFLIERAPDGYTVKLDGEEIGWHRDEQLAVKEAVQYFRNALMAGKIKSPADAYSVASQYPEAVRQRVAQAWEKLASHKSIFRFASSKEKDLGPILFDMGQAPVIASIHDQSQQHSDPHYRIEFYDGTHADLVFKGKNKIYLNASSLLQGSQMGPVLYQAALVYAFNNKKVLVPDPAGLSHINSYRRTEQMLSGALRLGTTKYMRPHPDQGLYGWIEEPKTKADDEHNIALMAITSMRGVQENASRINDISYDFQKRGFMEEDAPLKSSELEALAKSDEMRNIGAGRSTIARAIFTRSLITDPEGADSLIAGDVSPSMLLEGGETKKSLALYSKPGVGKRAVLATAKGATVLARPVAAALDLTNAAADVVAKIAGKPLSYATSRIYDRLISTGSNFLKKSALGQSIAHGVVSDYGLPEPYLDRRDERDIDIQRHLRRSKQLIDKIAALDDAESMVAYQWMQERPNSAEEARLVNLLPETSRAALIEMKEMVDQFGREAVDLGLLSQETYDRNKMAYLHRSYKKYEVQNPQAVASAQRAKAIRADQFRGRGLRDDVASSRVPGATKGDFFIRMEKRDPNPAGGLGRLKRVVYLPAGQPISAGYQGWRNDGVWEARFMDKPGQVGMWRDFTREERERMGEIREVRYSFARTMIGAVHDIETARFLKWVSETHSVADEAAVAEQGGKVADAVDKMTTLTTYADNDWVQVPGTMAQGTRLYKYGALQSRYIPGHIWNDIRSTINVQSSAAVWKLYDTLLRAWKVSKTALSPVVHTNNVMSNFVFLDLAEVQHKHLVRSLQTLLDAERGDEKAKALLERYLDSGAELGTPALHELRKDVIEPLLSTLQNEENEIVGTLGLIQGVQLAVRGNFRQAWAAVAASKSAQLAAKPFQAMIAAYGLEDSVFRIAKWIKETEAGVSDRDAGKLAREAFLDYRINAPWISALRRGPFPFFAFTYRAAPLLAEGFAKKPWKLMKYFAAAYAMNALAYGLLGLGKDDEKKERAMLPDEKAGYTILGTPRLMRMPWNDKNGQPVFLDIRRWIPGGDIFDVSGSQGAIPVPSWLSFGGYWALAIELASNKSQFTGQPIWKDSDTLDERVAKVMDHLFKFAAPNIPLPNPLGYAADKAVAEKGLMQTYSWKSLMLAGGGATDDFGREKSVPEALASAVGVKIAAYPEDQLKRNILSKKAHEIRDLDETTARYKRELRRGGLTQEEFEARMNKQAAKRLEVNKRYAEKLGLEPIKK